MRRVLSSETSHRPTRSQSGELLGRSGVGKSTLVRETKRQADERGATVRFVGNKDPYLGNASWGERSRATLRAFIAQPGFSLRFGATLFSQTVLARGHSLSMAIVIFVKWYLRFLRMSGVMMRYRKDASPRLMERGFFANLFSLLLRCPGADCEVLSRVWISSAAARPTVIVLGASEDVILKRRAERGGTSKPWAEDLNFETACFERVLACLEVLEAEGHISVLHLNADEDGDIQPNAQHALELVLPQ